MGATGPSGAVSEAGDLQLCRLLRAVKGENMEKPCRKEVFLIRKRLRIRESS